MSLSTDLANGISLAGPAVVPYRNELPKVEGWVGAAFVASFVGFFAWVAWLG